MTYTQIIKTLKSMRNEENIAGMTRFGINSKNTLGISVPDIRKIAKSLGKSHVLAGRLWASGIHEARVLAALVDEPGKVTKKQMDAWVRDFDSWDVCDQACNSLFLNTGYAVKKACEWVKRKREYERRAGFVMIAVLAWHSDLKDAEIRKFLPLIKKYSLDKRNFVIKAVNWALRNIGKRNISLNKTALKTAREMAGFDSRSARWAAKDAIRELTDEKIVSRLRSRGPDLKPGTRR
jgi:3-methyladenine DNA glycosylase AlkD